MAEKVMGWPLVSKYLMPTDNKLWRFSTDISAAWQVVEHMREKGIGFNLWDGSGGLAYWRAGFDATQVTAATAPLAICRAALAAVQS